MNGMIRKVIEKAATAVVLVMFALVVPGYSVLLLSSCSANEEEVQPEYSMWCTAEIKESVNTSYHILRDNKFTGIDDNGYTFVTADGMLGGARVLEPFEGNYRALITINEVNSTDPGDSMTYVVNGQGYYESNVYDYNTEQIDTRYFKLDTDEMEAEEVDLIDHEGLVTTDVWQTQAGTVLVTTDDSFFGSDPLGSIFLCVFDNGTDNKVISMDDVSGENVFSVLYVISVSESELVVSFMNVQGIERTIMLDMNGDDITLSDDQVPAYLSAGVTAYNDPDGGLFISDCTGIYRVSEGDMKSDSPEFTMVADWARCMVSAARVSALTPVRIDEDGALVLFGVNDENYDLQPKAITARITACDFPYEGRQEITVGIFDSLYGDIGTNIAAFNRSNTAYYVRPVFITTRGVAPLIDLADEDTFDISGDQLEALRFHAYRNFIQSEAAPDVVITYGMQAQFQSSDLFVDLNGYIDSDTNGLNREDYFNNIFSLSEVGGELYTIPLTYYVDGIVEYDPDDMYIMPSDDYSVTSITFAEYDDKVTGDWNDYDPLGDFLYREDIFSELIGTHYTDFVDLANETTDFSGSEFVDILNFSSGYESNSEDDLLVFYYYYDTGVMYTSLCYVDDLSNFPQYLDSSVWMGLPSSEGNTPSIGVVNAAGITQACDDKDAAWSFMTYLLSVDAQEERRGVFGLPVNRNASENSLRYPRYAFGLVEKLTDSATRMYYSDNDLLVVSNDVINAYAAGEITAEEAGEMLSSQVSVRW